MELQDSFLAAPAIGHPNFRSVPAEGIVGAFGSWSPVEVCESASQMGPDVVGPAVVWRLINNASANIHITPIFPNLALPSHRPVDKPFVLSSKLPSRPFHQLDFCRLVAGNWVCSVILRLVLPPPGMKPCRHGFPFPGADRHGACGDSLFRRRALLVDAAAAAPPPFGGPGGHQGSGN